MDYFLNTRAPYKHNWLNNMIQTKFNITESIDVDEFIGVNFIGNKKSRNNPSLKENNKQTIEYNGKLYQRD